MRKPILPVAHYSHMCCWNLLRVLAIMEADATSVCFEYAVLSWAFHTLELVQLSFRPCALLKRYGIGQLQSQTRPRVYNALLGVQDVLLLERHATPWKLCPLVQNIFPAKAEQRCFEICTLMFGCQGIARPCPDALAFSDPAKSLGKRQHQHCASYRHHAEDSCMKNATVPRALE